jgi:hypothetical protein
MLKRYLRDSQATNLLIAIAIKFIKGYLYI